MTKERLRLIVVGSGKRAYWEHALAALGERCETTLVERDYPTWQGRYVETHRIADTTDATVLFAAVGDLRGEVPEAGILTWNPESVVAVAEVARKLGMRHLSVDAARLCRDRYATRGALREAALPDVRFHLVRTEQEAADAAEAIGLPVVVKRRRSGGGTGALAADDEQSVRAAYRAAVSGGPSGSDGEGVLVEECLQGPAISVDSAVVDGVAHPVHVARTRPGPAPHFGAAGHLVAPWRHEPWAEAVADLVEAVHRAVGADWGVTRTELRLTPDGPRVVDVTPCIGGDLIPMLGKAATGLDPVAAAAALAFEQLPDLTPVHGRCAEVRFLSAPHGGTVERIDLPAADAVPGLAAAVALAENGARLVLSPDGPAPRYAALIAVGDTPEQTRQSLDSAQAASSLQLSDGL